MIPRPVTWPRSRGGLLAAGGNSTVLLQVCQHRLAESGLHPVDSGQGEREQIALHGGGAEQEGDGDVVAGPAHDIDRVTWADLAGLDYPEEGAGPGGLGEPPHRALLAKPVGEGPAGDAAAGDLHHQSGTDPPALADERVVDVVTARRQVLPERAVAQRPAEFPFPGVEILASEGVGGPIVPAVKAQVAYVVAGDPARARRPGSDDPHRPRDRPLADAGLAAGGVRVRRRLGPARVHREHPHVPHATGLFTRRHRIPAVRFATWRGPGARWPAPMASASGATCCPSSPRPCRAR